MKTVKQFQIFILSLLAITLFNCNDNDDTINTIEGESQISIKLMDNPGDYDHVFVEVLDVKVKVNDASDDENGWISLNAINPGIYDLLELTGGINVLLVDNLGIPSGTLNQIRLILGDENSVVIDGVSHPLNTPSAQQSGLKIKVNEPISPNIHYTFLLDFDVDQSIVVAGNSGNINLKPVIRASVEANSGALKGNISPANVQTLVTVSNGIISASAYTDGNGNFLVAGLPNGIFDVTITPDPLSLLEVQVIEDVEISVGQTLDLGLITLN
jgi:hypothetical protein